MADEQDLSTEIKVSVNPEGVESGVARTKRSLASLGQAANEVGEAGARGLGKMNAGTDSLGVTMDRTTKGMVASLQRQIAAIDAGGTATRQYQESIARLRGADMAALKPFLDQLDAAKAKAEAAARAQGSLVDRLGAMGPVAAIARAQLAALAGSFTLGAVFAFVKGVNDGVDALNDIKDATGDTIENISALEDVGKRTGASLDLVGGVLIKFNDLLSKATPKSDIALQLKAIGLNAEELRKLNPSEALRQTAMALAGYADDANKARLIQDLFGKSVKEAAPFLADLAEQGSLVAKVTAQQAEEADKFNKELFAFQANASEAARALSGPLIEGINAAAKAFREGRAAGQSFWEIARNRIRANEQAFWGTGDTNANTGGATGSWEAPEPAKPSVTPPKTAPEMAAEAAAGEKAAREAVAPRIATIRRGLATEVVLTKAALDEIASMRRTQAIGEREQIDRTAAAEISQLERQRTALQAEMAVQATQKGSIKEMADLRGQIDVVDTQIAQRRQQQQREITELTYRQREAILAVVEAQKQQDQDDWDAYNRKQQEAYNNALIAANDYTASLQDASALTQLELSLMGQTTRQREIATGQYQVHIRLKQRLRELERSGLDAAQQEVLRAKYEADALNEMVQVQQRAILDEWSRTAQQVEQSLTDALMRGFESGKGFLDNLKSVLKSTVLTVAVKPIVSEMAQPLIGTISSLVGQMLGVSSAAPAAATGSSGSNVLGMASNLTSAYSMYANAGSYISKISSMLGLGGGSATTGSAAAAAAAENLALFGSAGSTGGAVGGGAAAAGGWSASSVIPIIGWILAGIGASSTMYGKGYSINGVETGTDMLLTGGVTKVNNKVLGAFMSDKWADILSGGPLLDKTLDLLGISTGEKRFGGQYGYSATSDQVLNGRRGTYVSGQAGQATFLEGPSGGQFAQDKVGELITSTVKGINGIFDALESDARVTDFVAGLETSGKGRGGVYSGGTLTGGVLFGESGLGNNYKGTLFEKTSTQSPNAQKAFENFTLDLQQATIQALQKATDIPKSIQEYLKQFNAEEMTTEQIQEALTAIGQRAAVIGEFRDALKALPFENLRALSFDTAEALIAAAGGLDVLNTNLSGYFDNYYSDEERRAASVAATSKAFTELGLVMPSLEQGSDAARAAFRAMVGSIDVTTEKGREQYVGLLALQGAFAELTPLIDTAAEAAQAAAAALQERQSLEAQLLQLQGDTDELRRRQLASLLNDENRALQQAIYDLQDKQAAEAAAQAAANAAEQVKAAWQSVADSIVDEINRIRGVVAGDSEEGFAYLQSQFAVATAQARAGDKDAAASLPDLSRQVLEMAQQTATSSLDLKIFQAQIAASLVETTKAIAASQGVSLAALTASDTSASGWSVTSGIAADQSYVSPAQNYAASESTSAMSDAQALVAEMRALRDDLRAQAAGSTSLQLRTARATEKATVILEKWDDIGMPAEEGSQT